MNGTHGDAVGPAGSGSRAAAFDDGRVSADAPARDLVLAMDLGGTKALSGVFHVRRDAAGVRSDAPCAEPVFELRQRCDDHPDLVSLLDAFFAQAQAAGHFDAGRPAGACIALAGPVQGDRARLTNRPWTVDADALRRRFGLDRVCLVNDFAGAAAGVEMLGPEGTRCLQAGVPDDRRPRAVLGPGTGLGVALLVPQDGGWRVVPGEGGHMGFAPRSPLEVELWRFLFGRGARVDAERLLCGPGLSALDAFLRGRAGDDAPLRTPETISARAAAGEACAGEALDLFAAMLGAFAGDVALLAGAQGGVYVAGGMAPRVLDARRSDLFVTAFRDKGGHAAMTAQMPVHLVLDARLGLLGAARIAADDAARQPSADRSASG